MRQLSVKYVTGKSPILSPRLRSHPPLHQLRLFSNYSTLQQHTLLKHSPTKAVKPKRQREAKYLHQEVWPLDGEPASNQDPLAIVSRFADPVLR